LHFTKIVSKPGKYITARFFHDYSVIPLRSFADKRRLRALLSVYYQVFSDAVVWIDGLVKYI